MSWLDDLATLNRPFGVAEYREHTAGIEIEAAVFVETGVESHYALLEAQVIAAFAQQRDHPIRGIVVAAPLEFGEQARAYLEVLKGTGGLVKGVRRLLQSEPDPDFCLVPRFVDGAQLLAE